LLAVSFYPQNFLVFSPENSMVFHVSAYEIHGFPLLRKTARRCFLDARSRPHSHPAAMEEVAPLDVKKTCFLLDEREIKH